MLLRVAQVVVTEGKHKPWSLAIRYCTNSPATHAFLSVGRGQAVEAWMPTIRRFSATRRMEELRDQDRAFAVLDLPHLHLNDRVKIAAKAEEFVGRPYDWGQMLLFGMTGRFWQDGAGTQVCSRLITASFKDGMGIDLFPASVLATHFPPNFTRLDNLRDGAIAPVDLLKSSLEVVAFSPSSRVRDVADFLKL